ncbi:hypothetical protein FBU30_007379 [Linnemannia zychae]|nr:hypothetical protein FBU30_007379 [Linnemannia zychae]
MAVLPYSNTLHIHGVAGRSNGATYSSPTSRSTIQPTVDTISDLGRECDQHIVRLYVLPTPGTNGFTTTHTFVRDDSRVHSVASSNANSSDASTPPTVLDSNRGFNGQKDSRSRAQATQQEQRRRRRIYHLTRISETERGVVHLTRLHISSMIIMTSSITYLSHLVSLRLQGNRLTDLPDQIFRLPSLRELDVSQNRLTEIPGLIGMLGPTLEELFLQSNQLQSLPQQLGRLTRLRLLDIADNQLGCIPVEVQRLVSESLLSERLLRRASQMGLDSREEGSSAPPTPLDSPNTLHEQGPGSLNTGSNEEGGHDDDDYVQIRQGMKCWARGNWFWQVGAPRSTVPLSSVGTVLPLSGSSSISISQPSKTILTPPTTFLNAGSSFSALPFQPHGTPSLSSPPVHLDSAPTSPPYYNNRHQHIQNRNISSPKHPVDQRGYSKDSYTSCSWTLSLADICSQIVGEKLNQDPHYFCHVGTCPYKRAQRSNRKAGLPTSPGTSYLSPTYSSASADSELDKSGECMVTMIPDWIIEQLGLHRLAEMRQALDPFSSDDVKSQLDEWESYEGSYSESRRQMDAESVRENANNINSTRLRSHRSLQDPTIPMQLTLVEKEMECEFCSVCQKRLYFPGLRWKGVGVMDERIVPLEWVACSVQCRAQAEREEHQRKANNGKVTSAMTALTSNSLASTVGVTPITEEDTSGSSENEEQEYFGGSHHPKAALGRSPRPERSQTISVASTMTTTTPTRARSGTQQQDSPTTSLHVASSIEAMTSKVGRLDIIEARGQNRSGSNQLPIVDRASRSRDVSMIQQLQQQQLQQQQLQHQQQLQQRQHHYHGQQQQRNYRETIAYGLIKSKILRRRTRTLSL